MRVKCNVIGVSHTGTHYSVVLEDETVNKVKLPVILSDDAGVQIISIRSGNGYLDNDLLLSKQLLELSNLKPIEVNITDMETGIFKCKVKFDNDKEIETSVSNALYLREVYDCDLYVSTKVMCESGVKLDMGNEVDYSDIVYNDEDVIMDEQSVNIEEQLTKAIENEDFELAAKLRDKLNNK